MKKTCASILPLWALLAPLVVLWALPTVAVVVEDLAAVQLPVADRSATALDAARRRGLADVIVRLSGQRASLEHPDVAAVLPRAERYLVQYSYREDGGKLSLRLEYDAQALRQLLRESGLPLWTANRPPVLAWLVVSDGQQRRFASSDELPAAGAALAADFRRRGLPLRLPLYDLNDRAALPLGVAWRQDSSALVAAAQRYGDVEVLAGRVARLSDGRWLGDWRFLQDGRWHREPVAVASLEAFTAAGADLAARSLAARYAVVAGDKGDLRLQISVGDVSDFDSYRRVRAALTSLEPVDRVLPERMEAGRVMLRVESTAAEEQLARIIELDSRFRRRAPPPGEAGLHYRWQE